jgi:triacylglycerol lipase
MSFLVELPREAYSEHALDLFTVSPNYSLDNARAMMWLSQLAYETAHRAKVDDVLNAWGLTERAFIDNPPLTAFPFRTACAVTAGGRGATIVAFAGSDPLKINDWITDFTALPSSDDIHRGFESAVDVIWPRIAAAITNRPPAEQALVLTGHSLGGALAIVAAQRAASELRVQATAVYTYGGPRPGGTTYAAEYNSVLGDCTFRLVHGTDIVPTVPPPLNGRFRHVGRSIQCASGAHFDAQTPISSRDEDKPDFVESLFTSARNELQAALAGRLFAPVGSGMLGRFVGTLPPQVRDHVPASYFGALAAS